MRIKILHFEGCPSHRAAVERVREILEEESAPSSADEPAQPRSKSVFISTSLITALAASLCCILPIVAAVTGLGVFAVGEVFGKWRPYLLAFTSLLLTAGFVLAYRDYRKACAPGSLCATRPMNRWNLFALGLVTVLVLGLAAFPYYSGTVAKAVIRQPRPGTAKPLDIVTTASFRIPDMDCPACAVILAAAFQRLPGVRAAKIDYPTRKAVVTYDPGKQNPAAFEKVVTAAGFHVQPEPRS